MSPQFTLRQTHPQGYVRSPSHINVLQDRCDRSSRARVDEGRPISSGPEDDPAQKANYEVARNCLEPSISHRSRRSLRAGCSFFIQADTRIRMHREIRGGGRHFDPLVRSISRSDLTRVHRETGNRRPPYFSFVSGRQYRGRLEGCQPACCSARQTAFFALTGRCRGVSQGAAGPVTGACDSVGRRRGAEGAVVKGMQG